MGLEGGPSSPDFYEGETAIDEIARAEMLAVLNRAIEGWSREAAAREIAADPELEAMIGVLIEQSQEWDPYRRAHLRKMIALRLGTLNQLALQATQNAGFFDIARLEVEREVEELKQIESLQDLPDLWDLALQDLLTLESGEDGEKQD